MQDFNWTAAYDRLNTGFKPHEPRPLIGITGNYSDLNTTLGEAYYRSVLEAGGIPVVLPPHDDVSLLKDLLDRLDGILLSGGADMNPLFVGEEPIRDLHGINHRRDLQELLLARLAYDRQLPMLGICRGIQLMVASFGGTASPEIYTQPPPHIQWLWLQARCSTSCLGQTRFMSTPSTTRRSRTCLRA